MNGRILVVDDEQGLREALAEKLRHSGHEVETAAAWGREQTKPKPRCC